MDRDLVTREDAYSPAAKRAREIDFARGWLDGRFKNMTFKIDGKPVVGRDLSRRLSQLDDETLIELNDLLMARLT